MRREDRLLHKSPLFDVPGCGPHLFAIDLLHTWHLGALALYVGEVLWLLLHSRVLSPGAAGLPSAEQHRHGLLQLRAELWLYYAAKRREDPEWKRLGSQVDSLTLGMLGPAEAPGFRGKAAETRGMLDFCVAALQRHSPAILETAGSLKDRSRWLLSAGCQAQRFEALLAVEGRTMSSEGSQKLLATYLAHFRAMQAAGCRVLPKHHLMLHLIQRSRYLGNPRFYMTYKDDSANGLLAGLARSCHRTTFGVSVHHKFNLAQHLGLRTE